MIAPRAAAALVALLAAASARAAEPARGPDLRPPAPHAGGDTRCDACHSTETWGDVAFAHERTGFPLVGGHRRATCRQCHPASFSRPVSRECSACHRDAHRGQLGARCRGCHDEQSWKSRFDADAHRRTGFPLSGRHAAIPCEECHGDRLDRGFARPVSTCFACHAKDYPTGAGNVLDHAASGFGTDCRQCHSPWRFANAFFPAHQVCFDIAAGPHAGIRCLACHTTLAGATVSGTCMTNTAACTRCHPCSATDPVHGGVLGYQCADRKCYECHRFSTFAGPLSPGSRVRRVR